MPRIIFLAILIGLPLLFIGKVIVDFLSGISGSRSNIIKDRDLLSNLIEGYELEPWKHEEIDLISRRAEVNTKTDLVADTSYGVYFSIYEEPILAFAVRRYHKNDRKLIVCRYNDQQYHMVRDKNEVILWEAQKELGKIKLKKGISMDANGHKIHIDSESSAGLIPVSLNGDYTMSVIAHEAGDMEQIRVIKKVNPHKEEEGSLLLMSIAYALIDQHI